MHTTRTILTLALASTLSASAAELTGVVTQDGAPAANVEVRIFKRITLSIPGCAGSAKAWLGRCSCPDGWSTLEAALRKGFSSAAPVATVRTSAAGAFSATVPAGSEWVVTARTDDGAFGAQLKASDSKVELFLAPLKPVKVAVEGLTPERAAVAALLAQDTGELLPLTRDGDTWSSAPTPARQTIFLVVGKGLLPHTEFLFDGHGLGMRRKNDGDAPAHVTVAAPKDFHGTVTADGRPRAGVEVVGDPDGCALTTRTNAHGEFTLPSLYAPRRLTPVVARAPGLVATGYGSHDGAEPLALVRAASLELTVVDPSGKPVPGVEVWLGGQHTGYRRSPSDARGVWIQKDLQDETVRVLITAPYLLVGDRDVKLSGPTKARVTVQRGEVLRGHVVNAKGQPVTQASLRLFYGDELQVHATDSMKDALREAGVGLDAAGRFEWPGLLPGAYELEVESPTEGKTTVSATVPGSVEVALGPTTTVEGDVRDLENQPVAEQHLSVARVGDPNHSWSVLTDAKGHFRLVVPSAGSFEVALARFGTGNARITKVAEAKVGGGAPVQFVVPKAVPLQGQVVDAAGKPQAGLTVRGVSRAFPLVMMYAMQLRMPGHGAAEIPFESVWVTAGLQHHQYTATTGPDGRFSLPVPEGALVEVSGPGVGAMPVLLEPEKPATITVKPRGIVRGRVLSPAGTPQRSFTVNAKSIDAIDGRFELPLPVSGQFTVQIVAGTSPEVTRQVEVPAGGAPLELGDLKLEPGGTVAGTIVAAASKAALGDAEARPSVRLKGPDGRERSAMVQKDGRFEIDRVGPGSFTLVASAEGYAPAATSVKAGARGVTVKLERLASLELTVTQKGERLAKASLDLTGPPSVEGASNTRYVETDADGMATVAQLAPGPWTVQLRGGPKQTVTLIAGQRQKLKVAAP